MAIMRSNEHTVHWFLEHSNAQLKSRTSLYKIGMYRLAIES